MNNFLFSLTTEHLIKLGEKSQAIIKKITNSLKSNNIRIVKLQVKYKVEQSFYEVSHSRQLNVHMYQRILYIFLRINPLREQFHCLGDLLFS